MAEGEVSMDPEKVSTVNNWLVSVNCKQLQRFLGFPNFYRRFFRNFSTVAAPLHALTFSKASFMWTPQAEQAFQRLKDCFVSAPILVVPKVDQQFIVKFDASEAGVEAVLSQ